MKTRYCVVVTALIALFLHPSSALADQAWTNADVVCSHTANIAVVRFGMSWNDDPPAYPTLPVQIDGGLSSTPPVKLKECRQLNGKMVKVRIWSADALAHGLGGGDPAGFFDLWIGSHKVLSNLQWKPRGYTSEPWVSAIIVTADKLIVCLRPVEDGATTCGTPERQ